MDNSEKILKTFENADKALKTNEIIELSGIEKKEVDKLIKVLKAEGKIYSPKRCFYDVKK
ncbi:MAG: MarR family transcriptional regulator [Bacteroidales bacterium]|nr:MarR family transcriptional regulator [Bacteroidales bacterium]MBN2755573.1 MarR family transcriptional regulator [Bacteroidales bacterium]